MSPSTVLLTGVTGFVGKVVLERLASIADKEQLGEILVVIRRQGASTGEERLQKVLRSPCFAHLTPGWSDRVGVIEGDLSVPRWGMSEEAFDALGRRLTHIIHCAASVDFDLPVGEAAEANIDSALHVLDLARRADKLATMVAVSTAYVTPHPRTGIARCEERLVPLPRPPSEFLDLIRRDGHCGDELLALTGHPNTYTLTKCINEHLLVAHRGDVPLVIARPSVVSAALRHPMPGWIDSAAAFAGAALYTGIGAMPAFIAHPDCRLDIVPVDHVAERILDVTFRPPPRGDNPVPIVHIAAGYERSCRFDTSFRLIETCFKTRPFQRAPALRFLGPPEHGWAVADLIHRRIPTQVLRLALTAAGDTRSVRSLDKANKNVEYMSNCFFYFTNLSFDFQCARPFDDPGFSPERYIRTVCDGIYRHVLSQDDTEVPLIGNRARLIDTGRAPVTPAAAVIGRTLETALHRIAEKVTFDLRSIEAALATIPDDSLLVLAPNHRSYLDFLLLGWLCHIRPGLGLELPRFAAAMEFSRIPVLGELFRQSGAFFLQRGVGGVSEDLNQELHHVAAGTAPLIVFLEGKRSRDRSFLPPKRGVLRALAATGRSCAVLPVGFSFDRVPEEGDLALELEGLRKPAMSVPRLVGWATRALRGGVDLGRIHIGFGSPLLLDATTDVTSLAERVMNQQRSLVHPSTWHLRRFLAQHDAMFTAAGVDEAWLTRELQRRGARVLTSGLDPGIPLPPSIDATLHNHWSHWFPERHATVGMNAQLSALMTALRGEAAPRSLAVGQ